MKLTGWDWKDIGTRAAKTFAQTFLSIFTIEGWELTWKPALGAAIAAAVSVIWNSILEAKK